MVYLRLAHVGEVQVDIWSDEHRRTATKHGIQLL
jgi:asparagine synthetase A